MDCIDNHRCLKGYVKGIENLESVSYILNSFLLCLLSIYFWIVFLAVSRAKVLRTQTYTVCLLKRTMDQYEYDYLWWNDMEYVWVCFSPSSIASIAWCNAFLDRARVPCQNEMVKAPSDVAVPFSTPELTLERHHMISRYQYSTAGNISQRSMRSMLQLLRTPLRRESSEKLVTGSHCSSRQAKPWILNTSLRSAHPREDP